jgi:hypothetical protein
MFDTDSIEEFFDKVSRGKDRWVFKPKWNSPLKSHFYALTFIHAERRFALSRMKIEPFVSLEDPELVEQFARTLDDVEVAECMRRAMSGPHEDDVPF